MTNFEKIRNMTQDETVSYIGDELCEIYGDCEHCPMVYDYGIGDYDFKVCMSDFLVDWLKMEIQTKH